MEDNNNTKKSIDRNTLLFIGVIAVLLILALIKFATTSDNNSSSICAVDGCNNESVFGSIYCDEHKSFAQKINDLKSTRKTYSDDVITLTYNPDSTVVQELNSPGIPYSLIALNAKKTFDDESLYNNSVVYITAIDTPDNAFEYYNNSIDAYKVLFASFVGSTLDTIIYSDDIAGDNSGDLTTLMRCDKTLSNGRKIKAKLLHIDENMSVYAFFSMLPDEDQKIIDEFTDIYNSIRYNGNTTIINTENTVATTENTTEATTIQVINETTKQLGVLNLKEAPNTSARVDEIARQAKSDASYINDAFTLEAINYIKNNYPNYFTDNNIMEKTMYYGYLLEYAYENTNDLYAELGMDTYQAVKYVYRGTESINDTSTQSNLEQIAKNLAYFE